MGETPAPPDAASVPDRARRLPDEPDLADFAAEADRLVDDGSAADVAAARTRVAGRYGFADWQTLEDRIWLVDRLTRWPTPAELTDDPAAGITDPERLANRLCRLGCLTWTADDDAGPVHARRLLARSPWLAGVNAYTMALTGQAEALAALLGHDPEAARRPGGPHDWPPLLYLCYGRLTPEPTGGQVPGEAAALPLGSATATLQVLLEAGADADSGFLWHGRLSPFTALTGVFGGGADQPPHPEAAALADLLLRYGADPNDHQTLVHRMADPDDTHLRVLLRYGLGQEHAGRWREQLGDHYPEPARMLIDQLRYAASHGLTERVALLLDHDVPAEDPAGARPADPSGAHPAERLTAFRLAVLGGHRETARLLARAGADTGGADRVDELTGRLGAGDGWHSTLLVESDPALVPQARARFPQAVSLAAQFDRLGGVLLLLAHGWDPDVAQPGGRVGLHFAARAGRRAMVQALLDHHARPDLRDGLGATPADWARGAGHTGLADQLDALVGDAAPPTR
ncbi:hypothetical protein FHX74_001951 [Friedmanniella endophytica]|uniref:Ankyrin repeat-containing protein n=1 Tax=Microlunatus kandeliicorticis TaxID=1759536 RepID=A0A7W3ISA3_9ACTN|nr:ankyrin repeat domain-containing protein [Microlunatus kandeliicorticis]MBA8794332.1 hypothetical protein [Microlunatus kandeliicorticis]